MDKWILKQLCALLECDEDSDYVEVFERMNPEYSQQLRFVNTVIALNGVKHLSDARENKKDSKMKKPAADGPSDWSQWLWYRCPECGYRQHIGPREFSRGEVRCVVCGHTTNDLSKEAPHEEN